MPRDFSKTPDAKTIKKNARGLVRLREGKEMDFIERVWERVWYTGKVGKFIFCRVRRFRYSVVKVLDL
jgi:hypothetical protein